MPKLKSNVSNSSLKGKESYPNKSIPTVAYYLKHKHSQVLFQNEKIKNLNHTWLPSTGEKSSIIDHESMCTTWNDYVLEVGNDVTEVREEEHTENKELICNAFIEEHDFPLTACVVPATKTQEVREEEHAEKKEPTCNVFIEEHNFPCTACVDPATNMQGVEKEKHADTQDVEEEDYVKHKETRWNDIINEHDDSSISCVISATKTWYMEDEEDVKYM
eukprot:15343638-Ditylum_brightwellii.AAC.1